MKIVYLAFSYIPSRSANSLHVMKMCEAFAKLGHDVYLIVPDKKECYEPNVSDVYDFYNVQNCFEIIKIQLSYPIINLAFFWPVLIIRLFKIKPDLIYGRYLPGSYLSAKLGYKVIFEVHYYQDKDTSSGKILDLLVNHKKFIKLVTISETLRQAYIKKGRANIKQSMVAHDASSLKKPLNINIHIIGRKNAYKVGYIGNLFKGKGMEVISKLVLKIPEADFHIIGGYTEDIAYWKKIISADNIFFHGFISQNRIEKYIGSMDICLLPNQKQVLTHGSKDIDIGEYTSPLKLFDYMACEKPILASDLPVLKEVLVHEYNCLLCVPDEVNSWVISLRKLFKDEKLRLTISQNAFRSFCQKHTWINRAHKILDNECI